MDHEQHERVREIFHEIFDLDPAERQRRIEEANLSDTARRELDSLLARVEGTDLFDEDRAGVLGAQLIAGAREEMQGEIPDQVGAYEILGVLGEGGMGVVYSARREDSSSTVALKVLRDGGFAADELVHRFRREGELLGRLHHPGIAAFYDAGEARVETRHGEATLPFIAMELVEGQPLTLYADEHELDDRQRIELVARTCDAIQHAHEAGAIHRDPKPSNVLVERIEGDPIGQPQVLDFGVAHATEADVQTMTGTPLTTPRSRVSCRCSVPPRFKVGWRLARRRARRSPG